MLLPAFRHGLRGAFAAFFLMASLPAFADAFDDEVARLGQAKASFGHDIDAEGKVADFVKAGLGAFEIPHAGAERLKKIMVNGYDYWTAARAGKEAGQDPQLSDFNKFFIKSMLDSVSPKELVRLKRMLGTNAAAAKAIKDAGIDVTDAVAGALPDGQARDVIEAAAIAAIDSLCPTCAVGRTAAVIALNEGRKLRAVFEDDRTRALYEAWKQGDGQLPQGLRGGDAVYVAARRAIEEARAAAGQEGEVSEADVERAILARFDSWRRGEAVGRTRAEMLARAKPDYDRLDDGQRRLFGPDPKAQAAGFAKEFLDAWDTLKQVMGDRPAPPSLVQDAVFLALTRADPSLTMADWRNRLRQIARSHGWPDPFPLDPTGVRERVSRRLKQLNHYKMEAVFDTIGVPDAVRKNLYGCLCSQVPHGVGVGFIYAPSNGKPCLSVGGFGTWSEAFPTLEIAYDACFEAVRVPPATGKEPVPFDEYLSGRLTGKAN
nr:hypothetical protein [Mesorhizobium sp.]